MMFKKIKVMAQVVGFVTMGLLAMYGLLNLLGGAPAWAASGQASVASTRSEVPQAAPAATVPDGINFQGYLRDDEGNLMSGYYTMTFSIYTDSVGSANTLWSEQQISVTVRDGYFNVLLGDDPGNSFPADLFTSPDRYIGVTVDPYAEMVPRQRFVSVPYAFHADRANGLSAADGDPQDAVTVNDAGNVRVESGNVRILSGGMCIDSDGFCDVPAAGELRVSGGGIHGGNISNQDLYLAPDSGNVGIGTESPLMKLDVAGGAKVQGSLNVTSSNGDVTVVGGDVEIPEGGLCVDSDGGCAAIEGGVRVGDGGIQGTTNSNDNVYMVPSNGNVGVGYPTTQTLSHKLDVQGNIAWSGHLQNMTVSSGFVVDTDPDDDGLSDSSQAITLVPGSNSICFLVETQFEDIDGADEYAQCRLYKSGGDWILEADSYIDNDNYAYCQARCLQW